MFGWWGGGLGVFIASFVHGRADVPALGLAIGRQALLSMQSWPGLMSFSSSSTRHALIPAKSAQQNKLEMWSWETPSSLSLVGLLPFCPDFIYSN